jgi:aldose 1-epimerase
MDVYTTEPGIQVYTGNLLNSSVLGKNNAALTPRMGICLETQHFPDTPNHPGFPSVILKKGEQYFSKTVLRFSTA